MKGFRESVKHGGRETGRVKENLWSKELGCQAAVKFRMTNCSDVRVNVIYVLMVACGFFLILAQLLTRNYELCTPFTSNSLTQLPDLLVTPHAQPLVHVNTSAIDASHQTQGQLREFKPHGLATHLFIEMGAYRGSAHEFSIVGLVAKAIQSFHEPAYQCEWLSKGTGASTKGRAYKTLPDWNYGKLYTVVVITCSFKQDVGVGKDGGELLLQVGYGDQFRDPERFAVLMETPGEYNATKFEPPYPYDYVYCGSSIYGDVSPQRMREWLAYHAFFLGERSHFMFHDAGGFHPEVWTVLEPWIKAGRVSVHNVRQQEMYDGYYHNQFLVVNDCLFRSRFMAKWTFFFDVDEYLYVAPTRSLKSVLNSNPNVTQITFEQVPISGELCVASNQTVGGHAREWALEKLVYRKILKRGVRYDRKYVLQARYATATGVHMSMNMRKGKNFYPKSDQLRYYHYHGTINQRQELCSALVPPENKTAVQRLGSQNHRIDETMAVAADLVKAYERQTVGALPFIL